MGTVDDPRARLVVAGREQCCPSNTFLGFDEHVVFERIVGLDRRCFEERTLALGIRSTGHVRRSISLARERYASALFEWRACVRTDRPRSGASATLTDRGIGGGITSKPWVADTSSRMRFPRLVRESNIVATAPRTSRFSFVYARTSSIVSRSWPTARCESVSAWNGMSTCEAAVRPLRVRIPREGAQSMNT